MDALLNSYSQDKRVFDFYDHLILRLYTDVFETFLITRQMICDCLLVQVAPKNFKHKLDQLLDTMVG